MCLITPRMAKAVGLGLLTVNFGMDPAFATEVAAPHGATTSVANESQPVVVSRPKRVNFEQEDPSTDARHVADWVADSNDNHNLPFMIVDKKHARVFVFHADGRLRGAAPALLGLALGDDSVPGIGERALTSIHPDERTTPAGRFEAALDRNLAGKEILWVDYDTAISLHPVITSNLKERRGERLATPSPDDNRISYGCINVALDFFNHVVRPAFAGTNGIVYVLPETRSAQQVFASYDVDERVRLQPGAAKIDINAARRAD